MATYQLAVIIKNPSNDEEFLLVKQEPPPKFNDQEYDSYSDSDLWDLPSTKLSSLQGGSQSEFSLEGEESCSPKIDLKKFDLNLAFNQVLTQVGLGSASGIRWKFLKLVVEPNFGPGFPIQTVYILGKLGREDEIIREHCKWMCKESCLNWLLQVKPSSDRVGPLIVVGLLNDLKLSELGKIPPTLSLQEYPPGVKIIPMESRTAKPFRTTNLIVFAPESNDDDLGSSHFVAHGDALIVDPGCRSKFSEELKDIISSLPRKLIIFVTHHHHDHVDGLSVVQMINPDASLLAHENTMRRIKNDDWSLGYTAVSGSEDICIGGQRLRVVFAPGHTDGHLALLHTSTHSLIVGDHCVGQGSALLDITSGGNMSEYFQTTYRFLELSPHCLIPMHGRVNMWPKHMLCGYLKNRRSRESTILKAIEDGANTLFDIVAYTYSDVDHHFWFPAASNVKLHVEHLALQNKLPEDFSVHKFHSTCGMHFLTRWTSAYLVSFVALNPHKHRRAKLVGAITVSGIAVLCFIKYKFSSK